MSIDGLELRGEDLSFLSQLDSESAFDITDVRLFQTAKNLDRVFTLPNEHARGMSFFGAQGNGISANGAGHTPLDAIRGCLGEASERWCHSNDSIARQLTVTEQETSAPPLQANQLVWLADQQGCSVNRYSKNVDWVVAKSPISERRIRLPADFIFRINRNSETILPSETNGCATGPDYRSAKSVALLELIERHTIAMWWFGGHPASRLKLERDSSFSFAGFTTQVRRNSKRPFWLNVIESDINIPVVAALSSDLHGNGVIAGFGAHPNIFKAACSATAELCQMELALQLVELKQQQEGSDKLNAADKRQLDRANRLNLSTYPELFPEQEKLVYSDHNSKGNLLESITSRLSSAGLEPYIVDIATTEVLVPCVKAIVPGLETMDSRRHSRALKEARHTLQNSRMNKITRPSLM